jgi:hypothetical protein
MADVDQSSCEKALQLILDMLEHSSAFKTASQDTLVLESSNDDANSKKFGKSETNVDMSAEPSKEEGKYDGGMVLFYEDFYILFFCGCSSSSLLINYV